LSKGISHKSSYGITYEKKLNIMTLCENSLEC
jgi:hypothetical protein